MSTPPGAVRKLIHSILLSKERMEALTDGIFAIASGCWYWNKAG
jgi:hypothetical protein